MATRPSYSGDSANDQTSSSNGSNIGESLTVVPTAVTARSGDLKAVDTAATETGLMEKDLDLNATTSISIKLAMLKKENPLSIFTDEQLRQKGVDYAWSKGLSSLEDRRAFEIGAVLAKDRENIERVAHLLTGNEENHLREESKSRWRQPKVMYLVIVLCSICACVQGTDETVVNGGQLFYLPQFGIEDNTWLVGLLNGAPYLCCAVLGCWLAIPFNKWFGRRGTIFITCAFSALACLWQAFTNTWWSLLIARFALGLGIGPKSATVPIYAAECSPPAIRGALTMQWQVWTAFGVMLGYLSDLAFYRVKDVAGIVGLRWRLMMATAVVPALIVCMSVWFCPESPRWYMDKGRHNKAYQAMCSLRRTKIQAARDTFAAAQLLEIEELAKGQVKQSKVASMVKVPRNRRALVASQICMFMQQFCGVNVIAYYSSAIFKAGGFSDQGALIMSMIFGIINFFGALPAVWSIDRFGRRNLLLCTFPLLGICLFFTGFSFWIPEDSKAHLACIALGIYLFGIIYSPGPGPVPFTYSAEAYPLAVRTYGMSLATATTWFFNFVLSVTWPALLAKLTPQGAFSYYGAWNFIGFILVFFFVPETKGLTLEELDRVFEATTTEQVVEEKKIWRSRWERRVLRKDVPAYVNRFSKKTSKEVKDMKEMNDMESGETSPIDQGLVDQRV